MENVNHTCNSLVAKNILMRTKIGIGLDTWVTGMKIEKNENKYQKWVKNGKKCT